VGLDCCLEAVPDGERAIDYLTKNPCPDLLLLDLKMPKVNGFEVLQWIRDKPSLKGLPVVVISSSDLPVDKERAADLGATAFFVKRSDFEPLVIELDTRFFRKR
jgi:CheY-like chemotaxis protein